MGESLKEVRESEDSQNQGDRQGRTYRAVQPRSGGHKTTEPLNFCSTPHGCRVKYFINKKRTPPYFWCFMVT